MAAAESSSPTWLKSKWLVGPDLILAACLIVLGLFTAAVADHNNTTGDESPAAWWGWVLVILPAVPVAFRRTAAIPGTVASVAGQLLVWGLGLASPFIAPLVMIYTVCAEEGQRGRRLAVLACLALATMTLIGVFVAPDVTIDLLVYTSLAAAMAYLLGINVAQRRANEVQLAEELAIARVERDAVRERAAAGERQRIARELHDIVGHSLSVIAVRAEAADRVAPNNPDAAVDAVGAIATTARSSLAEVRRVLAGLREKGAEVELAPLPSLGSLPALVTSFAEAGLEVSVESEYPSEETVGVAVGTGTYRIVQEALTNVLKHGGPEAHASLRLDFDDQNLRVEIHDNGRGPTAETEHSDGSGLAGMRARAEVLGGNLRAGPRTGGGYQVVATLPVESATA